MRFPIAPTQHASREARPVQFDIPGNAPRLESHDALKVRAAAYRATRLYPGAVGELLSRELLASEEFRKALGPSSLTARVAHQIMTTPFPESPQ